MPSMFGQPLVILMSPAQVPAAFEEQRHRGNLFTLFLHCPLTAFCYISNINEIQLHLWDKAQTYINRTLAELSHLLSQSRNIDISYLHFYGDDFLRLIILRFIFCCATFRLHRSFKDNIHYPIAQPPLPAEEFFENLTVCRSILDLATLLDVRSFYKDIGD